MRSHNNLVRDASKGLFQYAIELQNNGYNKKAINILNEQIDYNKRNSINIDLVKVILGIIELKPDEMIEIEIEE